MKIVIPTAEGKLCAHFGHCETFSFAEVDLDTKEILSISLEPEIIDPDDKETLEDILVAAVNEAIKRVEDTNSEEMSKITGGLPGMPGMF